LKVSPDGAAYYVSILIDRTSGRVELPKPAILPAATDAPAARGPQAGRTRRPGKPLRHDGAGSAGALTQSMDGGGRVGEGWGGRPLAAPGNGLERMTRRMIYAAIAAVLLLGAGYAAISGFQGQERGLPDGIVGGNGRIEARQVEIAAEHGGRVVEITAKEGDLVPPGATLARIDTSELEAELDGALAAAELEREGLNEARAVIAQRESELRLTEHEFDRAKPLVERGHLPQATLEARQTALDVAVAALNAARAHAATAERRIAAAEAEIRRIRTRIDDSVLTAPMAGRVLYRLASQGEIVGAGQPVLTLLDLGDVYMEIFLPAEDAGRLALGAEGRIVLDVLPEYAIPAVVSYVSPEAQFTPKQVETLEEREKLVFRVRVRIPPELVERRIEHVKTGLRGMAYVKLSPSAAWPEALDRRIPPELFE
jgi:HlyD family secretion protein